MRSASPSSSCGVRVTCMPVSSSAKSSRSSPIRSFGPGRSPRIATSRPTVCEAARIAAIVSACFSGPAWEKLRRKTSVPASIICSSTPGDQLAGPTVATILVRRGMWAAALAIGFECISQVRVVLVAHVQVNLALADPRMGVVNPRLARFPPWRG